MTTVRHEVQHELQQSAAGPVGTPRHGRSVAWHLEEEKTARTKNQKANEGMQTALQRLPSEYMWTQLHE